MATSTNEELGSKYKIPTRKIMLPKDMLSWKSSEAYHEYVGFLIAMNEAVKRKKISDVSPKNQNISSILSLLEKLDTWITEIPPIEQPQRFGNKAFTQWYRRLSDRISELLKEALPSSCHDAIDEISPYIRDSFGNETRIDYGTGHEMSFAIFLYCLFKIGVVNQTDADVATLKIFDRYLSLVRKLQTTYRMEPAGSHGVWSLDDYQFLPFIWGSSQLISHPKLEPSSFPDAKTSSDNAKEYMFMSCIDFINQVKTGPFAEHSNQLWNISAVPTWTKVNSGLIKMYKEEVLNKFPVMQHLLFGSIFSFEKHMPGTT